MLAIDPQEQAEEGDESLHDIYCSRIKAANDKQFRDGDEVLALDKDTRSLVLLFQKCRSFCLEYCFDSFILLQPRAKLKFY